ncbi:hypothetical protein F5B20DRAFT_99314 [Whalleya microplaca]|nr:hypothetical protein F5B20DRAFT_99314 [Whalleya microplaca]
MAAAVQVMQSSAASTRLQGSGSTGSTAPVLEFVCLFTHDLRRKQKRWQDGRIKFHSFNKRVMVYDERGNFIGDTHWREDYEFDEGEEVELERGGTIVQVAECIGSRDQDLSELVDKRVQEKAQRQSAAVARRPPVLEPSTPHITAPHFQLRHKPLHNLIGTPTGHHGRALVPTESPYEERQKVAVSPLDDSARPTKRRKREASPPSKSGYAQSLFGASLTLSGRPSSTPSLRKQLPASSDPSNHGDDPHFVSKPTHAPITKAQKVVLGPALRNTLLANPPREPPKTSAQKRGKPALSSSPLRCDNPNDPQNFDSTLGQSRSNRNKEKHHRPKERELLQPISVNHLPRGAEKDGSEINMINSKSSVRGNTSTAKVLSREKSDNLPQAPQPRNSVRNRELVARNQFEDTPRKPNAGRKDQGQYPEGPLMDEPRTELRIQPRKKRGLLMVSEKSGTNGSSSISKKIKARIDHRSPTTLSSESANNDRNNDALHTDGIADAEATQCDDHGRITAQSRKDARRTQRNIANSDTYRSKEVRGFDDTLLDTITTSQPRGEEDSDCMEIVPSHNEPTENPGSNAKQFGETPEFRRGTNTKKSRGVLNDAVHHKACDATASRDDPVEEIEIRTRRNTSDEQVESLNLAHENVDRTGKRCPYTSRKQSFSEKEKAQAEGSLATPSTDQCNGNLGVSDDEGEFAMADDAPAPRLAHLGRKSIRSKEVIGFVFSEEPEHNSAARRKDSGSDGENQAVGLLLKQPMTEHSIQQNGDTEKAATTNGRLLQASQPQGHQETTAPEKEVTRGSVVDQNIPAPEVESILRPPQRQTSSRFTQSREEANVQIQMPEGDTAVASPQPPAKVILNPATRGKKAAKPSDAAGQIPQCPLPPEAAVNKPSNIETLRNLRKRPGIGNQTRGAAPAPMSGFTRANGGPWSREAHDLFEFTRPP